MRRAAAAWQYHDGNNIGGVMAAMNGYNEISMAIARNENNGVMVSMWLA
jgi:hypothetical protein